ncbi:PREDICTED: nuclear transcription factor Y subunit B-10-like [Ipomoea nil]|uniref:nuclear transcription factor Y subunit B-10-like n=1 Tax=Ipomoea nil TaxID=35883 RepID=UPI000900A942|nr:PREDICTED: nuclear transcription factor Y subunit B-10-like [Ipomoea nil]
MYKLPLQFESLRRFAVEPSSESRDVVEPSSESRDAVEPEREAFADSPWSIRRRAEMPWSLRRRAEMPWSLRRRAETPWAMAGETNANTVALTQQRRRAPQNDIPLSIILKIMGRAIHGNMRIADDAKETVQKCVTEFIHYVTAKANERSRQEQRKTVIADDLLWAMNAPGLRNYAEVLTDFIISYCEQQEYDRAATHPLPPPIHHVPFNSYAVQQGFSVPEFSPGPMNNTGGSASSSSPYGSGYFIDS